MGKGTNIQATKAANDSGTAFINIFHPDTYLDKLERIEDTTPEVDLFAKQLGLGVVPGEGTCLPYTLFTQYLESGHDETKRALLGSTDLPVLVERLFKLANFTPESDCLTQMQWYAGLLLCELLFDTYRLNEREAYVCVYNFLLGREDGEILTRKQVLKDRFDALDYCKSKFAEKIIVLFNEQFPIQQRYESLQRRAAKIAAGEKTKPLFVCASELASLLQDSVDTPDRKDSLRKHIGLVHKQQQDRLAHSKAMWGVYIVSVLTIGLLTMNLFARARESVYRFFFNIFIQQYQAQSQWGFEPRVEVQGEVPHTETFTREQVGSYGLTLSMMPFAVTDASGEQYTCRQLSVAECEAANDSSFVTTAVLSFAQIWSSEASIEPKQVANPAIGHDSSVCHDSLVK